MAKRIITDNPAQGLFNQEPEPKQKDNNMNVEKNDINKLESSLNIVTIPEKKETRSKKKLFMFEPSLYNAIEIKCKVMEISVNEAANQLFRAWVGK